MSNIRKTALDFLIKCEQENMYVNISADGYMKNISDPRDKALFASMVYGVIERKITLDYYIAKLSERSVSSIEDKTVQILRMGLYQLMYMDKIPCHAVVNESVSLCRHSGTRGFVNAVLRSYIRQKDTLKLPSREKNEVRYLSVKYSFPQEMCKFFISEFGYDNSEKYFSYFNKVAPTVIKINTLKITVEDFMAKITNAKESDMCHGAVIMENTGSVKDIYGYAEGLFYVQDTASQVAVSVLGATPGANVIDVCACPGGKSFGAAISMHNRGPIRCYDVHKSKLSLITNGAERLGINIISTFQRDSALLPEKEEEGVADFVICDVPCSGLGVLGKKADMRYRDVKAMEKLPELQRKIIYSASRYLKVGGVMLYSTCTINRRENEDVVQNFLLNNKNFSLVHFNIANTESNGVYTFMPGEYGTDGFFIAKIKRNE